MNHKNKQYLWYVFCRVFQWSMKLLNWNMMHKISVYMIRFYKNKTCCIFTTIRPKIFQGNISNWVLKNFPKLNLNFLFRHFLLNIYSELWNETSTKKGSHLNVRVVESFLHTCYIPPVKRDTHYVFTYKYVILDTKLVLNHRRNW